LKPFIKLLRTTLAGGILFLVPLVVLVVVLEKALALAHKLVDPLAEHIPFHSLIGLQTPMLLAVCIMVLFCFLAGFFARTALAQKIVRGLETSVLSHLPGYEFLKGMGQSMLGVEEQAVHPAVLVRFDDASQIGFQIEELENGLVAVFVPNAPDAHSGTLLFMTADRVSPVAVPPARMLSCLKRLGVGSNALLRDLSSGGPAAK
jgi:uncharacterized membrane protein